MKWQGRRQSANVIDKRPPRMAAPKQSRPTFEEAKRRNAIVRAAKPRRVSK